jgi:hypothetical protein
MRRIYHGIIPSPTYRGPHSLLTTTLKGEKGYYIRARAPLQRAMPY